MNFDSVSGEMLKGSLTSYGVETIVGYEDAMTQFDAQTNRWTATENNANNSWNCNFNNDISPTASSHAFRNGYTALILCLKQNRWSLTPTFVA